LDKNFNFMHIDNVIFLLLELKINLHHNFKIVKKVIIMVIILQHISMLIYFYLWLDLLINLNMLYNITKNLDIFDYHFDLFNYKVI
jgi:hypothetical protein